MNIEYRLKDVKVNAFAVANANSQISVNHTYTFDIAFSEAIDAEKKALSIFLLINLYLEPEKKNKVTSIQTETTFHIINFQELQQQEDIPIPLVTQLLGIAISTTRGILLVKCADTSFRNFILPIINPLELYKAFENTAPRLIEKANNCFAMGNTNKAIDLYTMALNLDPRNAEALNNRAALLVDKGEYKKALEDINKFLQINQKYAKAYHLRSNIYHRLGRWSEELDDLNKCLELVPDDLDVLNSKANNYRVQKRFEEAKMVAEKVINADPKHAFAYGTLAEIYGEEGNEETFYKYLEKALENKFPLDRFLSDPAYEKYKNQSRLKKLMKKHWAS